MCLGVGTLIDYAVNKHPGLHKGVDLAALNDTGIRFDITSIGIFLWVPWDNIIRLDWIR